MGSMLAASALPVESFAVAQTTREESCRVAKANLTRVQHTDRLMRVDIARRFEAISSDYLQPFASRVVESQLDGVALSQTVLAFNGAKTEFVQYYSTYEKALDATIKADCVRDNQAYHAKLTNAREKRALVQQSYVTARQALIQYDADLTEFIKREY